MKSEQCIAEKLNEVQGSQNFVASAYRAVSSQLGSVIRTPDQRRDYTEEAISAAIFGMFSAWKNNPSAIEDVVNSGKDDIAAYLIAAINNKCKRQLQKWRSIDENGEGYARLRVEIDGLLTKDEESFLLSKVSHCDADLKRDSEKVKSILIERGLSETEIEHLFAHLNGESYAEMAARQGGSADKYRKMVDRALKKANLVIA